MLGDGSRNPVISLQTNRLKGRLEPGFTSDKCTDFIANSDEYVDIAIKIANDDTIKQFKQHSRQ